MEKGQTFVKGSLLENRGMSSCGRLLLWLDLLKSGNLYLHLVLFEVGNRRRKRVRQRARLRDVARRRRRNGRVRRRRRQRLQTSTLLDGHRVSLVRKRARPPRGSAAGAAATRAGNAADRQARPSGS